MHMPHAYLVEKFQLAVWDLATGEGDARSRVAIAYRRFFVISTDSYPEHLRKRREQIETLLTRLGGDEGYVIPQNLHRMKNRTASKIAQLIVELHFRLKEEQTQEGY